MFILSPVMHCIGAHPVARVGGVDTNTIISIVYGTISILIAAAQLFFEYQKYHSTANGVEPPEQIAWIERFQVNIIGMSASYGYFGRLMIV